MEIGLFVHFISRPHLTPSHCNISTRHQQPTTQNSEYIKPKNLFGHKVLHSPINLSHHHSTIQNPSHLISCAAILPLSASFLVFTLNAFFSSTIFFLHLVAPLHSLLSHLSTVVRACILNNTCHCVIEK